MSVKPYLFFLAAAFLLTTVAPTAHAQESDVTVLKSGPAQAAADTDVTYNITVTNNGPDAAAAIALNDVIPGGMTFVSETHDPAFSCSFPAVGGTGTITCTNGALAANATANFSFVFHIDAGAAPGAEFTNVATVTEPTDPNEENNSSTVVTSTPPPPQSDLGVTKTGPSFAGADTDVTYSLTFSNGGPDPATNPSLTDTLPGDMTFVSITQDSGPSMPCTPGTTVTCTTPSFPAGAIATFTLVGHIPAGTTGGTSYTNVAAVSKANDLNEENNTAQTTLIVATVDMSVTKSGPGSVNAASDASYTIIVANAEGSDTATNVELTDVLPPGTTFVSLLQDNGVPSSCGTPPSGQNGTVTCSFATFPTGATAQFTLVINSGSAASIANTATVATESFDTDHSNDSDTANTTVTQSADLTVAKSGPPTVTAGTDVTYTVAVSNAGPSNAASVSLVDVLPANLTFVSATQTSGPTFNCSGGPTITCTIATFSVNASATFDFVAHVASSTPSGTSIDNTATATSATSDPTSPNSSTTSATTATSADVSVAKSGPAAVAPGTDITYTITAANAGPSDAANVSLTDTAPAGTTFVSVTQTSGPTFNCTGGATTTCTIASLAANASATFDLVLHVAPTMTGTITNTANVASTTPDPAPGNGASSSQPALVSPATTDLSITKTVAAGNPGNHFAPGSNATYTITATNNGPAFATNVTVTDVLPPGTTYVSATPSQGSCAGTTTVVCTLGILAPSASATITLVVTLPQTFGPIDNTATVTSDNADSNPANNSATAALTTTSEIPSLSPLALLLLALALAVLGAFVTRM